MTGPGRRAEADPRPESQTPSPDIAPPGRWLKRFFRLPVWLYRGHLGWLLGERFLMVTHTGRHSGRTRQTVLEVVHRDPSVPEWAVVSGYGPTSDWYRNLVAHPALRIDVGRRRFVPEQRLLDEEERRRLLAEYQRLHRRAASQLGKRLLGVEFDGSEASIGQLAARMPAVAFRPSRTSSGGRRSG